MGEISISSMMASFIFSVIGLWLFREGKRRSEAKLMLVALGLMGYSYFTLSPAADWGLGLALCGLAYLFWA